MLWAFLMSAIFYVENYTTQNGKKIFGCIVAVLLISKILEISNSNISHYLCYFYDILAWCVGVYVFISNYRKLQRHL